jgi:hypothetical protein
MIESPGWSFVMKNEDFDFQYPKKMIRSEEVRSSNLVYHQTNVSHRYSDDHLKMKSPVETSYLLEGRNQKQLSLHLNNHLLLDP